MDDVGNVPYAPKVLYRYDGQTEAEKTLTPAGSCVQPFDPQNVPNGTAGVSTKHIDAHGARLCWPGEVTR